MGGGGNGRDPAGAWYSKGISRARLQGLHVPHCHSDMEFHCGGAALQSQPVISSAVALRIPTMLWSLFHVIVVISVVFPLQKDILAAIKSVLVKHLLPVQNLLAQWRSITFQCCIHVQKSFL